MAKRVAVFFIFSSCFSSLYFFANCAQTNNTGNGSNSTSSIGNNTNSSGSAMFNPQDPIRGHYSTDPNSSTGSTTNSSSSSISSGNSTGTTGVEEGYTSRYGANAPLTIVNNNAFEDFRLGQVVNSASDITDIKVHVKLSLTNKKFYGGKVTITYTDHQRNSQTSITEFTSGMQSDARFNVWFRRNNADYFHGFFQENLGSVVLVLDRPSSIVGSPDNPQNHPYYDGSIWVMQFRATFGGKNSCNNHNNVYIFETNVPPLSDRNKKCWEISSGPFDCRTWRSGKSVNTFKAIYPNDNCYTKLGTFTGLNILKAFNVNSKSNIVVLKP